MILLVSLFPVKILNQTSTSLVMLILRGKMKEQDIVCCFADTVTPSSNSDKDFLPMINISTT